MRRIIEKTEAGKKAHARAKEAMALYRCGKKKEGAEIMTSLFEKMIWNIIHEKYEWMSDEDKEDLFQEGCVAILESMPEYNDDMAPSTYFRYRIICRMNVYAKEKKGIKKHRATTHNKIEAAEAALIEMGVEPTVENVTRLIDDPRITREVVYINKSVMNSAKPTVSLDQEMEGDFHFLDIFAVEKDTPEKAYEKKEMLEVFQKALSALPQIQQSIIADIFMKEMSIKSTANELGISEASVKRHKTLALYDLGHAECVKRYCGKCASEEVLIHLENEDVDIAGSLEGIIFID